MSDFTLSVITPERTIAKDIAVESIVLPSEGGQVTLLPDHINYITTLTHGTFAYKPKGDADWQVAFLSAGFAQVYQGQVSVLAETVELSNEMDIASAELDLQEIANKLKSLKPSHPDTNELIEKRKLLLAKLKAAKKKLH